MHRKAASFRMNPKTCRGLLALAVLSTAAIAPFALADERNFLVLLVNSPKSVGGPEDPDFSQGSPFTTENVRTAYFDTELPDVTSFKEFWEEISYCHVTITGDVFAWTDLPWPIQAPAEVLNLTELQFNDLDDSLVFRYGVGEQFNEARQMFPVDWDGNLENPFILGDPPAADPDEGPDDDARRSKPGLLDGVWTPGERFRDNDADGAWDAAEVGKDGGRCPDAAWYLDRSQSDSADFEKTVPPFPDMSGDPTHCDVEGILFFDFETMRWGTSPEAQQAEDSFKSGGGLDALGQSDLVYDPGEAWEDFLVRYDPTRPEGFRWVRVTEDYIRKNYPGDVEALVARTDNFTWDGPDQWFDPLGGNDGDLFGPATTTKMQHSGEFSPTTFTPRPSWLDDMWLERYGTAPPPWVSSIPLMIPFDPQAPDPIVRDTARPADDVQRDFLPAFFFPATGADTGRPIDRDDPDANIAPEGDPADDRGEIQPDVTGVYDGPVEFDDLASSIYHDPPDVHVRDRYSNGDMRLGEVTSPSFDNNSIFGQDLPEPDGRIPAAGPKASRIDGNKLMDAGNLLNTELLTWRQDGRGVTIPADVRIPRRSIWRDGNFDDCPKAEDLTPSKDCSEAYLGFTEVFVDTDFNKGYSTQETCCDISASDTPGCPARENTDFGIGGFAIHPATGDIYLANRINGDISILGPITDPTAGLTDCSDPILGGPPAPSPGLATATVVLPLGLLGLNNIEAITFDSTGTLYAIDATLGKLAVIADPLNNPQSVDVFDIVPPEKWDRLTGLVIDPDLPGKLIASDADRLQLSVITISDLSGPTVPITGLASQKDVLGNNLKVKGISIESSGQLLGIAEVEQPGTGVIVEDGVLFELSRSSTLPAQVRGRFNVASIQFLDFAIDPNDDARILAVNILPDEGRLLDLDPGAGTGTILADLSGNGMCAAFLDDNNDGNWTRFNEPFCDENGNEFFDVGGFRDWNLDGLIDQGETIVPGAMNYIHDTDPNTNLLNGVQGIYPFNRRRLMEDAIEANDIGRDFSDFVLGGELPGTIYGLVLAFPDDEWLGSSPHRPDLYRVNTNDGGPVLFPDMVTTPPDAGFGFRRGVISHLYGISWEGWPQVWDPTLHFEPVDPDINARPIGIWDLMGWTSPLVHPGPLLKRLNGNPNTDALYGTDTDADQLISIDPATGAVPRVGPPGSGLVAGLAYDPKTNTIFGTDTDTDQLIVIDPVTGVSTAVGPLGFSSVDGLAFDTNTDTLYGADGASDQLIVIHPRTGEGTAVGALGFVDVAGLAFDPNSNTLYGTDVGADQLIVIDPATGAGTAVGALGFSSVPGLAFDPSTNTLYGSVTDQGREQLIVIDPATGAGTFVGFLGSRFVVALAFDPNINREIGIEHDPWIDLIQLEDVLTPFAPQVTTDPQVITVETCETTGNNSYYVYTNPDRPAERYYFWRVSTNDTIQISDCSLPGINPDRPSTHRDNLPGQGLMIMHADTLNNPEGRPNQTPSPFIYEIIQADLLTHLEDGVNVGDPGDPFPGSGGVTTWVRKREDNRWNNNGLTGLEILDIVELDNQSIITFRWTPQDVPFFEFLRPPSGESINGVYQIAYAASDRFGGTKLEFFLDGPYSLESEVQQNLPPRDHLVGNDGVPVTPLCAVLQQVGALQIPVAPTDCTGDPTQVPKLPGLFQSNFPVRVDTLEDGDYFFFVRTVPGPGSDGTEQEASIARARVGNKGTGWITGLDDTDPFDGGTPNQITPPTVDIDLSKLETWTVTFEQATDEWTVEGSISGVQEKAFTEVPYTTDNADVGFVIIQSDECRNQAVNCFEEGDRFIFTTAGKSPHSARIRVDNGLVVIKPVADFTFRFDTGTGSPAKVLFDASASFNPDSNAEPGGFGDLEFIWDFGDGSPLEITTSPNIQHVFIISDQADIDAGEKEFQVSLLVRNLLTAPPEPSVNAAQKPVLVTINGPPEACMSPAGPFVGDTASAGYDVAVDASCSTDPDNDSILADWDFGDAFADQQNNPSIITDKPIDDPVTHTYKVAGPYTLTLTIREEGGSAFNIISTSVTVTGNQAPVAVITADPIGGPTIPSGLFVTFDGTGSFDPDDLRASDIVSYDWDFGDGNSDAGSAVTHTYLTNAPNPAEGYTARLTVTDTLGVAVSDTVQIFAGNQNPTAVFTTVPPANPDIDIFENQSVEFDGRGSSDPENAPLDFTWDFGDGNGSAGSVVNHTYPNAGLFTATLTVDDRRGGSNSTSVQVRVDANDGPVAVIAANPAGGAPPLRVDFSAVGTTDDRTPLDQLFYKWSFGDGSAQKSGVGMVIVNHTYNVEGTYTARVEVTDDVLTTTASIAIVVRIPDPSPPFALLQADVTSGPAALPVIFDASGSADPDDDLATFLWEFGDGSIAKESLATVTHLAHTYNQAGTFTARLTVFDMRGQSSTAFLEIVVGDGVGDAATAPGPAPFCGFGSGLTLSLGLVSLIGMKRRVRRPRRARP